MAASVVQLHSPVAPTGELLAALARIGGRVAHIVLPNTSPEHWYYGPAMAAAFPEATLWLAPGAGLGSSGGALRWRRRRV